VLLAALVLCAGCQDETPEPLSAPREAEIPADVIDPPASLPVRIHREPAGAAPGPERIAAFTRTMKDFFGRVGFFRWASWHSFGLHPKNAWNQPGYQIWWTSTVAVKRGDTVTFTWERPSDNSTAKVGRVLPAAISAFLASGDRTARDLALGYMRGLSATYDGMIWGDEAPVVDSIMARAIFHRNHAYELEGGRKVVVDYDAVRTEVVERRHDTIHNPGNPTWGDIYVRNKRSKDDFPYLYRDVPVLARLIRTTGDEEMRDAAVKLYRQVRKMARDIVEHGYNIRTKGPGGEPFLPLTDLGLLEDFASFVSYEWLFPGAECNAKLSTAYLASGSPLDNDCGNGDGGPYEFFAVLTRFWPSNMIWGYHVTAVSLALAFGDHDTARALLDGLAERVDALKVHPLAPRYVEWHVDLAQLLVLAAAYGLPLTGEEAGLVMEQYAAAAEHYGRFRKWDLWDPAVPDGEHAYIPDRYTYDPQGVPEKAFVRITEMTNLYEYCASPLKHPDGVPFVDCDALMGSDE